MGKRIDLDRGDRATLGNIVICRNLNWRKAAGVAETKQQALNQPWLGHRDKPIDLPLLPDHRPTHPLLDYTYPYS
jgi:hypothetical protein